MLNITFSPYYFLPLQSHANMRTVKSFVQLLYYKQRDLQMINRCVKYQSYPDLDLPPDFVVWLIRFAMQHMWRTNVIISHTSGFGISELKLYHLSKMVSLCCL